MQRMHFARFVLMGMLALSCGSYTVSPPEMLRLGQYKEGRGELDGAIRVYTRAIEADSSLLEAYLRRGHIYDKKGDPLRAQQDYNRVIAMDSSYAMAYFYRGFSHMVARSEGESRPDSAVIDFDKAIQLGIEVPEVFLWRAAAYETLEERNRAISDLRKFLDLAGHRDTRTVQAARERLERLEREVDEDDTND